MTSGLLLALICLGLSFAWCWHLRHHLMDRPRVDRRPSTRPLPDDFHRWETRAAAPGGRPVTEPCRSVNVRVDSAGRLTYHQCTRHSGHHDECVDKDGNAWTRLAEWIRQAEDTSAEGASTA